jgi:hypothetical protein
VLTSTIDINEGKFQSKKKTVNKIKQKKQKKTLQKELKIKRAERKGKRGFDERKMQKGAMKKKTRK